MTKQTDHGERLTFPEYQNITAVNWSTLKEAAKSLAHYRAALTTPREETPAMIAGRAAHTAVLEPDRFPIEWAVWLGGRRSGGAWDDFKAANTGRGILSEEEYNRALAIRDAVHAHPVARKLLARKGVAETSICWNDPATGLPCKGRLDYLTGRALVDLKTTKDGDLRAFTGTAARLKYHGQFAFYTDGLKVLTNRTFPVYVIMAEQSVPHDVGVFKVPPDALFGGSLLVHDLLGKVAEGYATKKWPGRYPALKTLDLPEWAFGDDTISDVIEVLE